MELNLYRDSIKFCLDTNPEKLDFDDITAIDSYFSDDDYPQRKSNHLDFLPAKDNTVAISAMNPTITFSDRGKIRYPHQCSGALGLYLAHQTGCSFLAKNKNYSSNIAEVINSIYKERGIVTNLDLRIADSIKPDIVIGTNYGINTNDDARYTDLLKIVFADYGIKNIKIDFTTMSGKSFVAKTAKSLSFKLHQENPNLYCAMISINKKFIPKAFDDDSLENTRILLKAMKQYIDLLDETNKILKLKP